MSTDGEWLEQLDLDRLARWMTEAGLGAGLISHPRRLAGGTQNLIVRFWFADREFVLRKAAGTAYANGSETMRREARVLAALADTSVPHARLIAACPDEEPLGGAFYLMEPVEGFNVSMDMPEPHASDPAVRRSMGFALIDGLAELRKVDYRTVGLADFGNPEGFLERQVSRWRSQLLSYAKYDGWPGGAELPDVDRIGDWLELHRPHTFKPGIQHGDYHIKNVLYQYGSPRLAAIVDWELTTIGDPMIDLGWLVATWREADGSPGGTPIVIEPWGGFPTADELVAYYHERTGEDVSHAHWYSVFACYKLALILEGTFARACAGKADADLGKTFHMNSCKLLKRAAAWITRGEDHVSLQS